MALPRTFLLRLSIGLRLSRRLSLQRQLGVDGVLKGTRLSEVDVLPLAPSAVICGGNQLVSR